MLAEQLNVLLCRISSLINGLGALSGTFDQFLGLALDFGVQPFKGRKN